MKTERPNPFIWVQAPNDFVGHVEPCISGSDLYGIDARPKYGDKYWR